MFVLMLVNEKHLRDTYFQGYGRGWLPTVVGHTKACGANLSAHKPHVMVWLITAENQTFLNELAPPVADGLW
jgi:hypothetical protein